MAEQILRVENLTMQFGGVVAVDNLSMYINKGEIVSLIGPNGAGKTTAFNAITGVYEPTNGAVYFKDELILLNRPQGKMKKLYKGQNAELYKYGKDGHPIKVIRKTPDQLTALGMARTFQNIRLFRSMTVFENVLTAQHLRRHSNLLTATLHLNYKEEAKMRENTMGLLRLVGLDDVCDELATSLPYGKQRRLEIARALATKPELLLLDEPAAGLDPAGRKQILGGLVDYQRKNHSSVIIVSHSMEDMALYCDDIIVMANAHPIMHGNSDEIFSREDELIGAGLDVPEVTRLMRTLRQRGFDVPFGIYTVDKAISALNGMLQKDR